MPKRQGIQLCYPFEEKRLEKWDPPYLVQPNGERCRALKVVGTDGVKLLNDWLLFSSECNFFTSVPHINKALEKLDPSLELDGELYLHGMDFSDIHSIVGRTVNLHPEHEQMEYHIFDIVSNEPQYKRHQRLDKLKSIIKPPLKIVPTYGAVSLEDVMQMYDHILSQGYEGIIVRHIDSIYQRKRSRYVMKFKPKKDDWYRIVGYKEEVSIDGIPKGRLGSLECQGNDIDTFFVGSGLTDDLRETLWRERESLIGNLCHVQYQNITSGKGVPRFPIFVEIVESGPEEMPNPLVNF